MTRVVIVGAGVGGFPQTNLFQTWGPRLGSGLWMVGDSIFPGQSTAAVALGGLRVAQSILAELGAVVEHSQGLSRPLVSPILIKPRVHRRKS